MLIYCLIFDTYIGKTLPFVRDCSVRSEPALFMSFALVLSQCVQGKLRKGVGFKGQLPLRRSEEE